MDRDVEWVCESFANVTNAIQSSPAIVVGAGVSGLAAALALQERGLNPVVLESSMTPGGCVASVEQEGYLCESGPNSFRLSRPESAEWMGRHGILDAAIDAAPAAKKRFLVKQGSLVALPHSLGSFFSASIPSWGARARLLRECFVSRGKDKNETVAGFIRRRLGAEWLDEMMGPLVSGIYAGDPERLVLRHALPRLYRLEQNHGSLIRGALAKRKGPQFYARLLSWPRGLKELPERMASSLKGGIHYGCPVSSMSRNGNAFRIFTPRGEWSTSKLVVATPAAVTSRFMKELGGEADPLENIPQSSLVVVHLGWSRAHVRHPLDGFGGLIRRGAGFRSLGVLFSSTLFPERSPPDHVLVTVFLGGRLDPEAVGLDEKELARIAEAECGTLLGTSSAPSFTRVTRWKSAIPQYEKGHDAVLEACRQAELRHPGLRLTGNYRHGVSLEDCLVYGRAAGLEV